MQECHEQLISMSELVSLQTGLSPDRQIFVVSENKRRFRGYGAAARDLAHSWTVRRVLSLAWSTLSSFRGGQQVSFLCLS